MKKLGLWIVGAFLLTACDATPGGNKGILPVVNEGIAAPVEHHGEEHGVEHGSEHEEHSDEAHTTEEHVDSTHAAHEPEIHGEHTDSVK